MMSSSAGADSAQDKMLGADINAPKRTGETMDGKEKGDSDWLSLAKQAHQQSKTYYETHLRQEWKGSLAHFHSEHAPGSKYHKVEYAKRSRAFRPKTRSMVLRKEAAAAGAFFALDDVCAISAVDPDSIRGQAAGAVMNAILNHRLDVDIPWFQICMGNYQTAVVQGLCCSKQYWDYQAKVETTKTATPRLHPETQQPMLDENQQPILDIKDEARHVGAKVDKPCVMPVAPDNLKFHPNADWLDPVNTSPYLIHAFPMFAIDVKKRAEEHDPKTKKAQWKKPTNQQLSDAARKYSETLSSRDDPSRRSGGDIERTGGELKDFDTVWIHENFIKKDGVDYTFYTLGTEMMLTDARPIEEVYLHGIRPFVVGIASLEAFTAFPQSKVKQIAQLQRLANETSNQRIDNVRLAMNGRYWVRDGKKIDIQALSHSTPGSVVLMGDPNNDVKWDRPADVTSSAYQEQDRINSDFDDLAGIFTTGTVQSDDHLNRTVGGMKLMSADAGAVQEYELKVFAVTYVAKVLRQLVKLEQKYETDTAMMALGGKLAQSITKYGIDPTVDDLMNEQLLVKVDVGVGATAPEKRMEKLLGAIDAFNKLTQPLISAYGPGVLQSPGVKAIAAEIFGAAGYKDSERFLNFGQPQPPPGQEGQQQGQDKGAGAPSPEVAAKVLEVEQSENERERENKLATTRIKDMGDTTRKIIDSHVKLILKGIEQTAAGRNVNIPSMPYDLMHQEPARLSA